MLIVCLIFIIMILCFVRADQEGKKIDKYDKQMDYEGVE